MHVFGFRLAEVYEQVFLHRVFHAVQLIVSVQLVYFSALIPILVSLLQQCVSLRIYPFVIDRCAVIQRGDGGGEEAAVPAYILQALSAVGAGNERCVAHKVIGLYVVRLAFGHALLGDNPLESRHVSDSDSFKLFHIDDDMCAE